MPAVQEFYLSKFVGELYVAPFGTTSWQRLASVRGLVANIDTSDVTKVEADDTQEVLRITNVVAAANGEFLENADRDTVDLIVGGTPSDIAATPVAGATQIIASPFTPNLFYKIDNQMGSGAAPTINSVTGGTDGALTADDDYHLVQDDDGDWGIVLNTVAGGTNITTLAQTITIDYDYTPNATESLELVSGSQELPRLALKIEAEDPDNAAKKRIWIFDNVTLEGAYSMNFLDVGREGDLTGTEFGFIAAKGSAYRYQNQILD